MAWQAISAGPYIGVFRLRLPVAEGGHVHVRECGGSFTDCPSSRRVHVYVQVRESGGSSRGSRLSWRAVGGIALRFAPFLA
jgi:hypothetical protein